MPREQNKKCHLGAGRLVRAQPELLEPLLARDRIPDGRLARRQPQLMLQREVNVVEHGAGADRPLHLHRLGGHGEVRVVAHVQRLQLQEVDGLGQRVQAVLVEQQLAQLAAAAHALRQHLQPVVRGAEDLQLGELAHARRNAHEGEAVAVHVQLLQARQLAQGVLKERATLIRRAVELSFI